MGLSFVGDVAWWAKGKSEIEVATREDTERCGRSNARLGKGKWGRFRQGRNGGHVPVKAAEETYGIGAAGRGL